MAIKHKREVLKPQWSALTRKLPQVTGQKCDTHKKRKHNTVGFNNHLRIGSRHH